MSATGSQAFDLTVSAKSIPSADECNMQEISICARYLLADQESNMALLEIGMISGFFPDRSSLHSLLEDSSKSEFIIIIIICGMSAIISQLYFITQW